MDSITTYDSGASTSATYSEPASSTCTHGVRQTHKSPKRKNLLSIGNDPINPENPPVKKRKVQSLENAKSSEKDKCDTKTLSAKEKLKADSTARHTSRVKTLQSEKSKSVKDIEKWLQSRGVDTESLKQTATATAGTDKLTQYKETLYKIKNKGEDEILITCKNSLDELAEFLSDFETTSNKKKNIEILSELIQNKQNLKKLITVDEKVGSQLLSLKKKIGLQIHRINYDERNKNYAKALYYKAKSLISTPLTESESSTINKNIKLLAAVAGISSKEKIKKTSVKSKSRKNKKEKIKEAFSSLEENLRIKYGITILNRSYNNLICVANKSIEQLKLHGKLTPKNYTYNELNELNQSSSRSEKTEETTKDLNQKKRSNIKDNLINLQTLLNKKLVNKAGNPDEEKTILAACDFLEEFHTSSQTVTRTQSTDKEKLDTPKSWEKERYEYRAKISLKLETILQDKYNIRIDKKSNLKLIYVAKECILKLKANKELLKKTYTENDFKNVLFEGGNSKKETYHLNENKKRELLTELQEHLNISSLNQYKNPDMENTMLAACDFLEKHKTDSHLPEFAHKATEKEFTAEPIPASTPLRPEPLIFESKESTCSSKNIHNLRKELAYAELRKTLKHWPALSTLLKDDRKLPCVAAYCIYALRWKEPLTFEAYQRFYFSRRVSERHDNTPLSHEELLNTQLDVLKKQLAEVLLHPEEMSQKQDFEIIRTASEYLNENRETGL
ncbi:hypothetical protein [Endozoicomonas euniceicola]|uniref:Uncharacterized protein n=1 Tax=Endozoicomonas euniceicola TaxID=1234143 RepID=A0ABY6GPQ9_9GAMM|nr:hypothetical protein [Endozoicomonas euniceicola]UYM13984.1 hypothetical protein NX720_13790 [Endozoicomonas euniceicola]